MKLALIPPYHRLTDIKKTDYQLALAHLFLQTESMADNLAYTGIYLEARERGDFVILDNGAYEGALVAASTLVDLANTVKPNELVIPDSMGEAAITQSMAEQFFHFHRPQLDPDIDLMYVAQGQNVHEVRQSIVWASHQDWIKTIALPRHLVSTLQERNARLNFAHEIKNTCDKDVHFLGASPLWTDEIRVAAELGNVRGMDTSMPYVYGYSYQKWPSHEIVDSAQSRQFYFDLEGDKWQTETIDYNVKAMVDSVY